MLALSVLSLRFKSISIAKTDSIGSFGQRAATLRFQAHSAFVMALQVLKQWLGGRVSTSSRIAE